MPKNNIAYSNTIIYKIFCNDNTIKDTYIGHTTNFCQRKCSHKTVCANVNSRLGNCKIYKFIREHGGWSNWSMVEIAKYNCKDSTEARIKEQEHYKLEEATLNSIEPNPEKKVYKCNKCNINCSSQKILDGHYKTAKHLTKITSEICEDDVAIETNINLSFKYYCAGCKYGTSKKSNINNHYKTVKHTMGPKKMEPNTSHTCQICNNSYKDNSGLWRHKKKCQVPNKEDKNEDKEIIKMLIKEKSELQNVIVEMMKTIQILTTPK